jgi:hypothetical protein
MAGPHESDDPKSTPSRDAAAIVIPENQTVHRSAQLYSSPSKRACQLTADGLRRLKAASLRARQRKQKDFAATQLLVLLLFIAIGYFATVRFRSESASAI